MCTTPQSNQAVLYPVKLAEPLNHIIFNYYHIGKSHSKYHMVVKLLLLANPNIGTERLLMPGEIITLLPLNLQLMHKNTPIGAIYARVKLKPQQQQVRDRIVSTLSKRHVNYELLWHLVWLHEQSDYLYKPAAAMAVLLGQKNRHLIDDIGSHYADYKTGFKPKGQYDYRRAKHIQTLGKHFKDMEQWSLGNNQQDLRVIRCRTLPLSLKFNSALMRLIHLSKPMGEQRIELAHTFKTVSDNSKLVPETFLDILGHSVSGKIAVGLLFKVMPTQWSFTLLLWQQAKLPLYARAGSHCMGCSKFGAIG